MSDASPEDFRRRGLTAFAREFGFGWGAVLGATFGLALIMSAISSMVDESELWWHWLVSVPLALVMVAVGCGVVVLSAGALFSRIALGYYGILSGVCPEEDYGLRANNKARALGDVAFFVVALVLGVLWFRTGSAGGALNWAMEGLLLAFSGVAFGLGGLIPRAYFRSPGRMTRSRALELPPVWIGLVIAASLGAGLSFGVCQAFADARDRAERAAKDEGR